VDKNIFQSEQKKMLMRMMMMACCRSLFQYLLKIAWDAEICLQQARREPEKKIIIIYDGSVWSNILHYYCQLSSEDKLGKEKTELKISVASLYLFIQTQEIFLFCVCVRERERKLSYDPNEFEFFLSYGPNEFQTNLPYDPKEL
jgi:hypothetical protein